MDALRNRGPIFTASFESDCGHCFGQIYEGDQIRYLDGQVACEDCVQEDE